MSNTSLKDALSHVRPEWSDIQAEKALVGMERKRRRRTVARASAALLVLIGTTVVLAFVIKDKQDGIQAPREPLASVTQNSATPSASETKKAPLTNGSLHLPDGTKAVPADDESELSVLAATKESVLVSVDKGRCDFEVTPNPNREFTVRAGLVTVTVVGTIFVVELNENRTTVQVIDGIVSVQWPGGSDELGEGEEATYPPLDLDEVVSTKGGDSARNKPNRDTRSGWRHHARKGEFEEAAQALQHSEDVGDTVEDLLLAADSLRLSGNPAKALPYLKKVYDLHRGDPRAPLAEFTRGRLLLLQLGQPRAAAKAFQSARDIAPSGNLAQDALAREVEAWHRAGEDAMARELAEKYLCKYPDGRRKRAVRRFGGLE